MCGGGQGRHAQHFLVSRSLRIRKRKTMINIEEKKELLITEIPKKFILTRIVYMKDKRKMGMK